MPTYADFGGWVISTIAGWFVVTADKSPRTTKLYDRTDDQLTLDDIDFGMIEFTLTGRPLTFRRSEQAVKSPWFSALMKLLTAAIPPDRNRLAVRESFVLELLTRHFS
jgi:hypothetical protein